MNSPRKRFGGEFKAKVALDAIKGYYTVSEIASRYEVHPNQVTQWKKQGMETLPDVLEDRRRKKKEEHEDLVRELYRQIGQLKVELDRLKKSLDWALEDKRRLIEPDNDPLSIVRQCELPGLNRSSWYFPGLAGFPNKISNSCACSMSHIPGLLSTGSVA